MKTRGGKFLMFLGAALAVMAFVVVYVVMSKGVIGGAGTTAGGDLSVPTVAPTTSIAVVNKDVPAYTILDASTVATIDVDASTVASNTTTSPSSLYGKMTLVPLTKGQQVRVDQLTSAGFSDILATGERAFSLAIPERNTFGNAVTENDRVDLIWQTVIEYERQVPGDDGKLKWEKAYFTSTKTLLQNVHVLRVITLAQTPPAGQGNQGSGASTNTSAQSGSSASAASVPLAEMYASGAPLQTVLIVGVTDQQAEVISYARENGLIDLTLRSSAVQKDAAGNVKKDATTGKDVRGDADLEKTTGMSIDTLIQQYGLPIPKGAAQQP